MQNHEEELLLNDYYTVGVVFSNETLAKQYTYKVDNKIELEAEDLVVILADTQFKIVRVRIVHDEPNINFASSVSYKYIVDKVDLTIYNELNKRSKQIKKTLDESKRRTLKKTMVENFKEGLGNDDIKALTASGVDTKSWL